MEDNKYLVVYKKSFFNKIKSFFKNIFYKPEPIRKKKVEPIIPEILKFEEQKNIFKEEIIFKENQDDLKKINEIKKDISILKNMSLEELNTIENAIINRQKFIDNSIKKLNMDIIKFGG